MLSVVFSPDGTLIASGSADTTIRIWDVATRTAVGEPLEGHSDAVNSVAFSPDGKHIASGSSDTTVRIWDVSAEPSRGTHSSNLAEPVVYASDGDSLVSGLKQLLADPHPSLCSMQNLEDGWILGPQGELILWVPPTQRNGLGDNRMLAVLGNPDVRNPLLNFDNMACGAGWAQCRTINSKTGLFTR